VDFCVTGDGELIIQNLIRALYEKPLNYDLLRSTKGICFLDENEEFCFTGYGEKPTAEQIELPDYGTLEADGSLPYFISDEVSERFYAYDGVIEPGKKVATVVMAKGCVARCTFCHRWEKGFRVLPTDKLIEHVHHLMTRYNVGFIQVADENFGADRKAAWEIASRLGEMGVKWQVAGVRTNTVTKESLQHWKDNGCVSVFYGIESGSQKMLDVMEKKTTLQKNIDALRWTGEVGLNTIIQLVLGLPGEDDKTIDETTEFLKEVSPWIKQWKGKIASEAISINYAQALPGTPLYEYSRQHGLIGNTLDEEEEYLIRISDTDAYKEDHFVNNTGLPLLKVLMWRPLILAHLDVHHYQEHNKESGVEGVEHTLLQVLGYYFKVIGYRLYRRITRHQRARFGGEIQAGYVSESGYFNIYSGFKFAPLLTNSITRRFFTPLLAIAVSLYTSKSPWQAIKALSEYVYWSFKHDGREAECPAESLRKTVTIIPSTPGADGEDKMLPLRAGR
jgi:anaerobic magnesium-protoporphyrin IX monomethyl ester cyclase